MSINFTSLAIAAQPRLGWPLIVVLVLLAPYTSLLAQTGRPDPNTREGLLSLSSDNMGVDPEGALLRLRRKVWDDPKDIDYAVALIRMLGTYGRGDREEAERASRLALQHNPGNVRLLYARAAVLRTPAALDVLSQISRMPGEAERASNTAQVLSLGLSFPTRWDQSGLYAIWAARLLYLDRVDEAALVLDAGEKAIAGRTAPPAREEEIDPKPLHAMRAIVKALQNDFDAAMTSQEKAGWVQANVEHKYRGLADVLLFIGKPQLAVRSFGDPKAFLAESAAINDSYEKRRRQEYVRVLAWSLFRANEAAEAERLLKANDDISGKLLLIRLNQEQKRDDAAKAIADAIVKPLELRQGSHGGPQFPHSEAARSLAPHYAAVLQWLIQTYPQKQKEIAWELGTGQQIYSTWHSFSLEFEPASVVIANRQRDLRHVAASGDVYRIEQDRRWLAQTLADVGRYAESADALMSLAVASPQPQYSSNMTLGPVMWSVYRRKADAETLFQREPDKAIIAWRLARVLRQPVGAAPPAGEQTTPDEAAKQLIAIGPGALSAVYDLLGINTISGKDRSQAVQIIQAIGGKEDVPALVCVLEMLTRDADRPGGGDPASVAAIERCLKTFTGIAPDAEKPSDRVSAWVAWWEANAKKIVTPTYNPMP